MFSSRAKLQTPWETQQGGSARGLKPGLLAVPRFAVVGEIVCRLLLLFFLFL